MKAKAIKPVNWETRLPGREMVLKRYYGQVPDDGGPEEERGFLSMAMNHLRSGSGGGEAESSPPHQLKTSGVQKRSKHGVTLAAAAGGADVATMAPDECLALDLTPKHHIRSPIIEETESSMEEELTRPRGQNEFNPPMSDR